MRRLSFAMAALALSAFSFSPSAVAQTYQRTGERLTEQQALDFLRTFFERRPRYYDGWCGVVATSGPITRFELSRTTVRIEYCGDKSAVVIFTEFRSIERCGNCGLGMGGGLCINNGRTDDYSQFVRHCIDTGDRQAFVNAWLALANPPPRDPATDTDFQTALQTARAAGVDRAEENRRVQVQVEALIAANQRPQAVAHYREALSASPDWADGHYNLALVAGELGEHAEAITAMRRYLYLNPNAADARAAQDQIYRWEVVLEAAR
jgi:tetratricopeptide (TPR) repeat protein